MSSQPTTSPFEPSHATSVASHPHTPAPHLPVNDLAIAYQPRRVFAATVSIAWNLLLAALFLATGAAQHLLDRLAPATAPPWLSPLYFAALFAGYAALNVPLELWFGYLEERKFALAKEGIRAWARDWLIATTHHGLMFVLGATLILTLQRLTPTTWLPLLSATLLALFITTTWLAADLIPPGLFSIEPADDHTTARLEALLSPSPTPHTLSPILIYSHPTLREYAGGLVGLANRQKYLISRSTLTSASDTLLRFVLLHDLGHRRYHHNLLAALAGWAWVTLGLVTSHLLIPTPTFATPLYIAWLALTLSAWMALGEPLLAYLGRRLEYQADRHYLRHGGTLEDMRTALSELAQRNLARTEPLQRRHTIFHPLPSVSNRLHAATQFAQTRED